ncbi:MAG: nucleotidyltransferase [Solirubrobacterales bacterium]
MSFGPGRLRELVERLVEAEVDFVLVGGLAVGTWGFIRGTKDVDIVPNPDPANLDRLADVLEELDGKVRVNEELMATSAIRIFLRTGDKTLVVTELGDVDVLQGLPQVPRFADLASRSSEADLEGVPVTVCSLEDLLAMKRAADRAIDRADIEALEIAHSEPGPEERDNPPNEGPERV